MISYILYRHDDDDRLIEKKNDHMEVCLVRAMLTNGRYEIVSFDNEAQRPINRYELTVHNGGVFIVRTTN